MLPNPGLPPGRPGAQAAPAAGLPLLLLPGPPCDSEPAPCGLLLPAAASPAEAGPAAPPAPLPGAGPWGEGAGTLWSGAAGEGLAGNPSISLLLASRSACACAAPALPLLPSPPACAPGPEPGPALGPPATRPPWDPGPALPDKLLLALPPGPSLLPAPPAGRPRGCAPDAPGAPALYTVVVLVTLTPDRPGPAAMLPPPPQPPPGFLPSPMFLRSFALSGFVEPLLPPPAPEPPPPPGRAAAGLEIVWPGGASLWRLAGGLMMQTCRQAAW